MPNDTNAVKVGARNSLTDAQRIQAIGEHATAISSAVGELLATRSLGSTASIKAMSETTALVAGYGVVFGGRDLVGDTFTKTTDFGLDRSPVGMPVFYDHSMHPTLKSRIGTVQAVTPDETGLFFEIELERSQQYVDDVLRLVEAGKIGLSTGAIGHLVRQDTKSITQWLVGEVSLTPTPAEPRTIGIQQMEPMEIKTAPIEPMNFTSPDEVKSMVNAGIDPLAEQVKSLSSFVDDLAKAIDNAPAKSVFAAPSTGDDDAVKSWGAYLRTGIRPAVKAAMNETTDAQGGYLVPTVYSNELIVALKETSILRMAGARVLRIAGTDSFRVPAMTHSAAAVKTSEANAFDEKEPTFTEIVFSPTKYTRLVKVSDELIGDSRINLMSQVIMPDVTQAFAATENTVFCTGDGTTEPQGVTVGASDSGVDTASATTITADNIIDTYHALGHLYRQNAVWLMHDTTIKLVRKLQTDDKQFLWQPGLQAGQPDRLMGRPVYTLNTMPELGTAGNRAVIFGDMSYFWIVDFGQESLRRLDELYAGTGQVGFRMFKRIGAHVMLSEAIVYAEAGA